MQKKTVGIVAILIASILWAIEPIIAKLSYATSTFITTAAVRALIVAAIGFLYAQITNKGNITVLKKEGYTIIVIALVASIFSDLLYFYALKTLPVVNVTLLSHLQPIFIVMIGYFILKEDKLTTYDYIGIIIMIFSAFLVTTRNLTNLFSLKLGTVADLLIIMATIAWALTTILARKYLSSVNAGVIIFYRFLIAGMLLTAYLFITHSISPVNTYQIMLGFIIGIGMVLYYEGLKRLKAAQTSSLELSSTFFAALLGFFILGELVTIMQMVGILSLCIGVYFLSRKEYVP